MVERRKHAKEAVRFRQFGVKQPLLLLARAKLVPTAPPFPASGVAVQNTNEYEVIAHIAGGTVSSVTINGNQVGTSGGTYGVLAGQFIAITYSSAPTWTWTNGLTTVGFHGFWQVYRGNQLIGYVQAIPGGLYLPYDKKNFQLAPPQFSVKNAVSMIEKRVK